MTVAEKKQQLVQLYQGFEKAARTWTESAVCRKGCADCCINVGEVTASTLEGLMILEYLKRLPPALGKELQKKLKRNRREKKHSRLLQCAFLGSDLACLIYTVRPFSCRRLYSVRQCGEEGPAVHREAWQLAADFEDAIRVLDDTGYSGHLSHILQLLNDARFRKVYLDGGFAPDDVRDFAREHSITPNRFRIPQPARS